VARSYLLLLAAGTISFTANVAAEAYNQAPAPPSGSAHQVTPFVNGDPEMTAAMAKARSTLPKFWKHEKNPGPKEDTFSVKVPIKDGDVTEYLWLGGLEHKGKALFGYVANDPEKVHNVKPGDRRKIADADIVAWMYYRNTKIVGNYTIRALFKNMPPADVKEIKAQLADP
jgi:uncharacterized protein YegJ (DUF2314 family)